MNLKNERRLTTGWIFDSSGGLFGLIVPLITAKRE